MDVSVGWQRHDYTLADVDLHLSNLHLSNLHLSKQLDGVFP